MLLYTIPKVMAYADGMKLLDMMPGGYSPEYVRQLFEALGKEGRNAYLSLQLPVDMIYPALFALSYSSLLAFFLRKLRNPGIWMFAFCYLPILAGFADYTENIFFIWFLKSYPNLPEGLIKISSAFSVVKGVSTSVYFVCLIAILIALGIQKIKK